MNAVIEDEGSRLAQLLAEAGNASPLTRINFRNPIAAYGGDAIPALAEWLGDPRLGAFAVRVLQRIAADSEASVATRRAVATALEDAEPEAPTAAVRGDIEEALAALGGTSLKDGRCKVTGSPNGSNG